MPKPKQPPTVFVTLEVSRCHEHEEGVEVWGYVGDYEVMVVMHRSDPRVHELKRKHKDLFA